MKEQTSVFIATQEVSNLLAYIGGYVQSKRHSKHITNTILSKAYSTYLVDVVENHIPKEQMIQTFKKHVISQINAQHNASCFEGLLMEIRGYIEMSKDQKERCV